MSYGIQRVLGKSNLERKIRILFGICLLVLIGTSFWLVNYITTDLINRNTLAQANGLKSDHILRVHLKEIQLLQDEASKTLFQLLATEPPSMPYEADVIVLDSENTRSRIPADKIITATEPNEVRLLNNLVDEAIRLQGEQNELETLVKTSNETELEKLKAVSQESLELEKPRILEQHYSDGQYYYYYTPIIFSSKSNCIFCHDAIGKNPDIGRIAEIRNLLPDSKTTDEQEQALLREKLSLAPPMFIRIKLDNEIAQNAITRSQAILVAVAIGTAVFSMAMLWWIVRRFIVKPLAHLRDVTEEVSHGKMDVRANVNSGDEFEELSRSFNRMLRHLMDTQNALQTVNLDLDNKVDEQAQLNLKLHEMNQVKSEFLANMSHELRTPLNSIIGFSEILESSKGIGDKQKRFASNIRNSGRLLLDLINDILDLAKLEAGKMEVKPSSFKIHQLVNELCEMVRSLAEKKNIRLIYEADDSLPELFQDKIKVRQILTNLLSNAIKFTPEGGRINISVLSYENDEIEIKVADTGVGIAESDQAIVFEKFRQGPSAIGEDALTREVSGTGLGLSIVKELCILLGGKIELESEIGKGSTFTVTLPWVHKQAPKINSEISQTIDELTKNQRVDLARTILTPKLPEEDESDSEVPGSEPAVPAQATTDADGQTPPSTPASPAN